MESEDGIECLIRNNDILVLGIGGNKILVSRNGGISPEPGPNMMWNAKYSPMANMMGRWFVANARNSVSLAQAKAKAQFCPAQKRTL